MLSEFFCQKHLICKAWGGVSLIILHGLLRAWIKFEVNQWFGRFYDVGGEAGEVSSGDQKGLEDGQKEVRLLLTQFAFLCIPGVIVHPFYRWIINRWVLLWRTTLITHYIGKWRFEEEAKVENGAQRVHEDTQKFARGLSTLVVTLLDSVLTLVTFSPLLAQLGSKVKTDASLPDEWLLFLCSSTAAVGVLGSLLFGWSLVTLEIANQRVEATLRKELVLLEEDHSTEQKAAKESLLGCLKHLVNNYKTLYTRFAVFSVWLQSYEQAVVLMPYFIASPLLYSFHPTTRISLGLLTQLSNAFQNVFSSLNIISDNWLEVTNWISCIKRLHQFEAYIKGNAQTDTRKTLMEMTSEPSN